MLFVGGRPEWFQLEFRLGETRKPPLTVVDFAVCCCFGGCADVEPEYALLL